MSSGTDGPPARRADSSPDVEYRETLRTPWWWYLVAVGVACLLAAEFHISGLRLTDWIPFGTLVPLSLLPSWVRPIAWLIAPTWGVRAIRESALGGHPSFAITMCVVLTVAYVTIASVLLRYFERLARRDATLTLTAG